ncbi:MAG: nucleotidyltransferase domain-containing protein [Gemmatimonadales bacterium]|nr:nucleotidyltransferase domain-containing protein [Gemmatimonadales bacterium]
MNPVEEAVPDRFTMRRLHVVDPVSRARVAATLADGLSGESDVAFAFLYGSFVDSEAFHDIDVGVYLRSGQSGLLYGALLSQRLSERVGFPVDARVLNGAPVSFLYHVMRGRVVLSRDDALLGDVMERTMQRYLDIAPLLRRSAREAFAT